MDLKNNDHSTGSMGPAVKTYPVLCEDGCNVMYYVEASHLGDPCKMCNSEVVGISDKHAIQLLRVGLDLDKVR